jgi:hypothetical protein
MQKNQGIAIALCGNGYFVYVWLKLVYELGFWCLTSLSTIFQLYRGGFIGGGNWSTRRKPPTYRKSMTNFITQCCIEYTSP